MNKKLQVFVSSTYTDLIEERQAAVEAILDAGHIPAGMELFKAGKSQMKTIQNWIDESDVYMLILGGRYGSIEKESGLSYTELEYQYAISKNMPLFSIVLNSNFLTNKINRFGLENILEQSAPDKYQAFKSLVMSKIVFTVDDCKDIKINIHSTLNDFLLNYNLIGWVRRDSFISSSDISEENYKLVHENYRLNKQVKCLQQELIVKKKGQFNNYNFYELVTELDEKIFTIPNYFTNTESSQKISALKYFIDNYSHLRIGVTYTTSIESLERYLCVFIYPFYIEKGLLEINQYTNIFQITQRGQSFYSLLEIKKIKKHVHQ